MQWRTHSSAPSRVATSVDGVDRLSIFFIITSLLARFARNRGQTRPRLHVQTEFNTAVQTYPGLPRAMLSSRVLSPVAFSSTGIVLG